MEGHRAWIALNLEHLRHNVAALQALLPPGCRLMPVVKANAYGHGAVPIARALSRLGIRSFCVATAEEGAELRRHHIPGDILILGFTPVEELSLVRRYDLIQTVVDWDYARQLSRLGAPIRVHVAVDTGMHRLGERWENLERIWAIFSMEHLQVEGMFTHLCADDTDKPQDRAFTAAQARAFELVVRQLRERGIRPPKIHLLGSYGLLNYPFLGGDYARVGMALYGVLSTGEDTRALGSPAAAGAVPSRQALHPADPISGGACRLRSGFHRAKRNAHGRPDHRLRRRPPPRPRLRRWQRAHPWQTRPHSGQNLHGSDPGRRHRDSGSPGRGHRRSPGRFRSGGDLCLATLPDRPAPSPMKS